MNTKLLFSVLTSIAFLTISFKNCTLEQSYIQSYHAKLSSFSMNQQELLSKIQSSDLKSDDDIEKIKQLIEQVRLNLKGLDFWLRYLEPISYKKINGPLPVEWETEVFEKFEKPYKREGTGLTLASIYLEEETIQKDSLLNLIQSSLTATKVYSHDSISKELKSYHHFYLCNRLFLLNLAAIYTTGFECPDTDRIIPELHSMLKDVQKIYDDYNESFPDYSLSENYMATYTELIQFTMSQPTDYTKFDHFTFIKNYVNPLFSINQENLLNYHVVSKSYVDYSINKNATSIFSKNLYSGQNSKGLFLRVKDEEVLAEIDKIGKLLFFDPILSGNNLRSCASCHKPTQYFTDTVFSTSLQFDQQNPLPRNSPSLINVPFHHLLMLDGKHISLQDQTKAVITNPTEMGSNEEEVVKKVLSCKTYNKAFKKFLKYTPQEKEVTIDHIVSAITFYYSKFSYYDSPFDNAMNSKAKLDERAKKGFNLFMSKAQCATCHFVPQFNGVKPPYTNSEFEVLGVPEDKNHTSLSMDQGRYTINPSGETLNAFRTGSVRNTAYTKPYMHNGLFVSLKEVIDFYDTGGGAGRGLQVDNQTLSSDSLHLTNEEKGNLILFIESMNENIPFEAPPAQLPASKLKILSTRQVGGTY